MSELPTGWAEATIGDVCGIVGGSTPKTGIAEYWGGEINWLTPDDLSRHESKLVARGARSLTQAGYESCSTTLMPPGSVLFTSRAPIGHAAISTRPICTNQGFKSFIPPEGLIPDYLYWYLRYATPEIRRMGSGTTFQEVSKKVIATASLLLPPTNEQRRIVDAIEEQLSRVDAGTCLLHNAARRALQLRSSVAVSELSTGWPTATLADVTVNFDGRRVPVKAADRAKRPGPYPYYGASGIIDSIDEFLFDGDFLLVAEDGANLVTRAKPIAFRASGRFWVNNHAHVLQPADGMSLRFLELTLNLMSIQRSITGSAQPKLTQANLNRLEVPVPPPAEQRRIVGEVERRLSLIEAMDATVDTALRRSTTLRRAILDRAFRGTLVPQDPDDEPASVLLERIAREQAARPSKPRRRRAGSSSSRS